jgi:hypothetical protein
MYNGFLKFIANQNNMLQQLNIASISLLVLIMVCWICREGIEKYKLATLYGIVIQMPEKIVQKKNVINVMRDTFHI